MCCFSAPASAAIIISAIKKKIPAKFHINWLTSLLWGGVLGLTIEHIAHQEIVPYFPYLTAMQNPADTQIMLSEILTVGGAMLLACTGIWIVMILISSVLKLKAKTNSLSQRS